MRISDVLAELQPDFPALSPSKLRFLEEQGLVEPRRTPGGYRQYSRADVERVRYVLRQQRDRYLPLRVIGEQLAALDRGEEHEPVGPRLATSDGEPAGLRAAGRHTADSLAEVAHGEESPWSLGLVEAGVHHAGARGPPGAVGAGRRGRRGGSGRARGRAAPPAGRSVPRPTVRWPWSSRSSRPLRGQRAVAAQAHAASVAAEVGELCARLHTALVRAGVAGLAP